MNLRAAYELLSLLTEKYPITDGGRHSLVLHGEGILLLSLRNTPGSWCLEGEDLDKPIADLFMEICTLVDTRILKYSKTEEAVDG